MVLKLIIGHVVKEKKVASPHIPPQAEPIDYKVTSSDTLNPLLTKSQLQALETNQMHIEYLVMKKLRTIDDNLTSLVRHFHLTRRVAGKLM